MHDVGRQHPGAERSDQLHPIVFARHCLDAPPGISKHGTQVIRRARSHEPQPGLGCTEVVLVGSAVGHLHDNHDTNWYRSTVRSL